MLQNPQHHARRTFFLLKNGRMYWMQVQVLYFVNSCGWMENPFIIATRSLKKPKPGHINIYDGILLLWSSFGSVNMIMINNGQN